MHWRKLHFSMVLYLCLFEGGGEIRKALLNIPRFLSANTSQHWDCSSVTIYLLSQFLAGKENQQTVKKMVGPEYPSSHPIVRWKKSYYCRDYSKLRWMLKFLQGRCGHYSSVPPLQRFSIHHLVEDYRSRSNGITHE